MTLGLVGMGRIGQAVAKRALAFGMRVVYHARTPKPLPYPFLSLEELLKEADVVSLHTPSPRKPIGSSTGKGSSP